MMKLSELVKVHYRLHYPTPDDSEDETNEGIKYIRQGELVFLKLKSGVTIMRDSQRLWATIKDHTVTIDNKTYDTKKYFESLFL